MFKSIFTHIYYWPTRRSKTINPKVLQSSISGMLFWSHNAADFNPISSAHCANGYAGCNMMTPHCHVTNPLKINMIYLDFLDFTIENKAKNVIHSAFLRLCNISVVKFQCPTYTFYSDFLKIDLF